MVTINTVHKSLLIGQERKSFLIYCAVQSIRLEMCRSGGATDSLGLKTAEALFSYSISLHEMHVLDRSVVTPTDPYCST